MRPRDNQRAKVYRFDDKVHAMLHKPGEPALSLRECKKLIRRAARLWWPKVRPGWPEVHDGRGRRSGAAWCNVVFLPRWTRYPTFVLHEAAHMAPGTHVQAAHGPEYMDRYISALVKVAGLDRGKLVRLCDELGIKVKE